MHMPKPTNTTGHFLIGPLVHVATAVVAVALAGCGPAEGSETNRLDASSTI